MTTNLDELINDLVSKARAATPGPNRFAVAYLDEANAAFTHAANPTVVLELCAEIQRLWECESELGRRSKQLSDAQFENSKLQHKLAIAMEALRWYGDEGNYLSDEEGCKISTAWQRNMLGYKAREALEKLK